MSKNWYMCTLHNTKVGYQITFLVLQNKYFFANFYVFLITRRVVMTRCLNECTDHSLPVARAASLVVESSRLRRLITALSCFPSLCAFLPELFSRRRNRHGIYLPASNTWMLSM